MGTEIAAEHTVANKQESENKEKHISFMPIEQEWTERDSLSSSEFHQDWHPPVCPRELLP